MPESKEKSLTLDKFNELISCMTEEAQVFVLSLNDEQKTLLATVLNDDYITNEGELKWLVSQPYYHSKAWKFLLSPYFQLLNRLCIMDWEEVASFDDEDLDRLSTLSVTPETCRELLAIEELKDQGDELAFNHNLLHALCEQNAIKTIGALLEDKDYIALLNKRKTSSVGHPLACAFDQGHYDIAMLFMNKMEKSFLLNEPQCFNALLANKHFGFTKLYFMSRFKLAGISFNDTIPRLLYFNSIVDSAEQDSAENIKLLIEHLIALGADVNATYRGYNACHWAILGKCQPSIFKLLHDKGLQLFVTKSFNPALNEAQVTFSSNKRQREEKGEGTEGAWCQSLTKKSCGHEALEKGNTPYNRR